LTVGAFHSIDAHDLQFSGGHTNLRKAESPPDMFR
jgi:hypothetical protein